MTNWIMFRRRPSHCEGDSPKVFAHRQSSRHLAKAESTEDSVCDVPAIVKERINEQDCPSRFTLSQWWSGQRENQKVLPRAYDVVMRQLKYLGPGITMTVAYADPGNWATDLQAGGQSGFKLLFVVLLAGILGIILQVLSLRAGIVCQQDLAVLSRRWILGLDRQGQPQPGSGRPAIWRRLCLWLLYLIAEGAIICTELAELVGSAIALNL